MNKQLNGERLKTARLVNRPVPLEKVREEIISILTQIGVTPENRPNFYAEVDMCEQRLREEYAARRIL